MRLAGCVLVTEAVWIVWAGWMGGMLALAAHTEVLGLAWRNLDGDRALSELKVCLWAHDF